MANEIANATESAVSEFEISTVPMLRGKGVTAALKAKNAIKNQVYAGVLIANGTYKKVLIDQIADADVQRMYQDVANAKYSRPIATLATIADKATEYATENGDVPRIEWLRFGKSLEAMTTKKGIKARELWVKVQAEADRIFLERKAARLAAPATQAA